MEAVFYEEFPGISRLRIPFGTTYTSVFLLENAGEAVLVDCATTDEDVDGYILPALAKKGYAATDVKAIVLTHRHNDHAGGLDRLLTHAPQMAVITGHCTIWEGVRTYPLAGHTTDSIGVYDGRTRTLISGDGLQGAGVDKYPCSTKDRAAYLETIERIRCDEAIENILFSHAYEPWLRDWSKGRDDVLARLEDCLKHVKEKEKL
ncbi:MAG: MBL fold metallo-hydrolase [Clostridia bacterium]|nr:MBL fold metallo-hydrolase [Clostridia bacterium]